MKGKYKKEPEVVRNPKLPTYPPSDEQDAFFSSLSRGGSRLLSASPGSGKSTTLTWAMQLIGQEKAAMVTFGKDIARDIEPRCPSWLDVGTCCSFGYKALAKKHGRLFLRFNLVQDSIIELFPYLNPFEAEDGDRSEMFQSMRDSITLIDRLRLGMFPLSESISLVESLSLSPFNEVLGNLDKIISLIRKDPSKPDFTGMIELPILLGYELPRYDTVYTDECQDFSPLMIKFIEGLSPKRVIAAGDEDQAIYGWAGASPTAMQDISSLFGAEVMQLNVCYRCGTDIVAKAKEVVDKIIPFSGNGKGVVETVNSIDLSMPDGSMILSRRNARLVAPCLKLIRNGRKAIIKGRDIGEQMIQSIGKPKSLDDLVAKFSNPKKGREDEAECIIEFANNSPSVTEVIDKIKAIFSDSTKGIICSSIHRAKGKEASHITIVDYSNVRMKRDGMSELDKHQERCLEFVALTRPKDKLSLIP
jgi:superfamily I DNA/RNA helicase